ncbi:MAG: glutamate 5-kinase [Deltaproteobacteria bacterium]
MAEGLRQSDHKPAIVGRVRRVVVKIGSAVLADERGLDPDQLERLSIEIAALHGTGLAVTVVTSGAIAAGRSILGIGVPRSIPERQATAAVGQILLMSEYQHRFARHGVTIAQILLDASDLADRRRWLNAEHAVASLHSSRILPIVNENDTVAVDELKFGDNDNLSAMVANLVAADLLVILSDVGGLFDANPKNEPGARRIRVVARVDDALLTLASGGSDLGTGGMRSKLLAAHKAAEAGIATIVADGREAGTLARVLDPDGDVGTLFLPLADSLARRKHWIAHTLKPAGEVHCDEGARNAVAAQGRSLLPSGIAAVSGRFEPGDCVRMVGPDGVEFARGLASYGASEVARIAGRRSNEVERILGFQMGDAVVHRNDLVVTASVERRESPSPKES